MKLTLLQASRTINNGAISSGDVYGFDVNGLPAGEHAKIALFNHAWRILRWNDVWHGNWSGSYPTPEAAVESLREELQAAV